MTKKETETSKDDFINFKISSSSVVNFNQCYKYFGYINKDNLEHVLETIEGHLLKSTKSSQDGNVELYIILQEHIRDKKEDI